MGVMVVVVDNNSSENGNRGQMLVSLRSQPYDNVTLSFTIDNGTSATGIATGLLLSLDNQTSGDNKTTQSLVFSSSGSGNWSTAKTVWVVSIDDQVDEGTLGVDNQTFNVWISQASVVSNQKDTIYDNDSLVQSNINLNTTGALTDNITLASEDNDTARILLSYGNSGDDNTSSEAGDNGSFTIKLQTRPLDNAVSYTRLTLPTICSV